MTGAMACCAIISLIILYFGKRMIRYKGSKALVAEEAIDMISNA
jgi:hypothetical protein